VLHHISSDCQPVQSAPLGNYLAQMTHTIIVGSIRHKIRISEFNKFSQIKAIILIKKLAFTKLGK